MKDECKQVKDQNVLMVLKTVQLKYIRLQVLEMSPIKTRSGRFKRGWGGVGWGHIRSTRWKKDALAVP